MKKNFIYLLLLCSLIAQAQVTPSYPTIKLTKTVEGVKQDSLLVIGTDKTVKHIPLSKISNVREYATASVLPVTGVAGEIYVVKNVNKIYRWNGTFYQELAVTDISGLQSQIDLKANDSEVIHTTGNETKTGRLTLQTQNIPPGTSGLNALAPIVVTGGNGGNNTNTTGTVLAGNGANIVFQSGYGGNTFNTSGTGLGGRGGNMTIRGGDGGTSLGTGTLIPGNGGSVTLQGGTSYGGQGGFAEVKAGNNNKEGYVGANVFITSGWGNNLSNSNPLYDGTVFLGVSASFTVRGNTVIGNTLDDRINKLQVNGTVTASPATLDTQLVTLGQVKGITDLKVDKVTGKSLISDTEITRLSTVVNQDISGKEDSFSKNTAFNKNFGVLANTVSEGNHLHSFSDLQNNPTTIAGYGITDANKSPINVKVTTVRTTAAKIGTTSSGTYTPSIGDRIDVTFTLGTAIANATLNIDGSGAKAIQLAGTNVTALSLSTPASLVVIPMYYNGTAWQIYGSTMSADTNTTYIEATTGLVVINSTQVVAVNTLYYANNASNVAFTLPTTCAVNSIVHIVGMNSTGTYSVIAPSGDNIILEGNDTGAGGILNGSIRSTLVLRCTVANTTWSVVNYTGKIVSNTGYSTNKESTVNKSDSYSVSSTTTYPSTKALVDGLALKANLASPTFTGTPTAPTAAAGTNTTQIATTAFVLDNTNANGLLEFNTPDRTVWNNGKGNVATNTSFGDSALRANTSGNNNTAIGTSSLRNTTTGLSNTAVGFGALENNITGISNTAIGVRALQFHTSNNNNIAIGENAGTTTSAASQNTTASASVFVGVSTSPLNNNETNQIVIGTSAVGAGSNTVTLGNTSITNTILRGTVTTSGSFINSTAPATNVLLAGGTTLSQNTAFNKNFGTIAGTVVEGGTLGTNAYSSTAYLPLSGGYVSGSVGIGTTTPNRKLEVADIDSQFSLKGTISGAPVYQTWYNSSNVRRGYFGFASESNSDLRLSNEEAGNIYISPNNGSTIVTSTVTATSYTATSLPVFENNAAASSLAVGQFYRTSTGVLMVKF